MILCNSDRSNTKREKNKRGKVTEKLKDEPSVANGSFSMLSKALILHTIYREIYTRIGVKQNRVGQVTDPSGKRTFVAHLPGV